MCAQYTTQRWLWIKPTWYSLKLLVCFLVRQQASQTSIHPSIHPYREADSSCPVAQDRASLWGTVAVFVSLSCLAFPRPTLVPLHACSVGKQASQPASRGTSIHPDSRPTIHPSIHTFERLTSCTPLAQNKASLWGTVVCFVPPAHASHSPDLPLVPPQGTGRGTGLSTPPFPFLFWYYRSFRPPPPHLFFLPEGFLSQALSFYWCPLFFSPSHKTDS